MKKLYFVFLLASCGLFAQNVTITKIIETGCADPFVKSVELYVDGTVNFANFGADATQNTADDEVILNYMNNGQPWANNQIDISALGTITDSFVYIVRDIALMQTEFPGITFDSTNTVVVSTATNGDDGYQVVLNGAVVSQFGRTETDADNDTMSNWNHNDAVAARISGIPDIGTWDPTHWSITAENDLDANTSCQNGGATDLETYFATLGAPYSLATGSGWTPTGPVCTTTLGGTSVSCTTTTAGAANDTYSATVDFAGANNGNTFMVTSTAGTVGGDSPTSMASGTITITNIPEGTDITVTVSDTGDGGICSLMTTVESPFCIPLIINEVLFDPAGDDAGTPEVEGDANGDGTRDFADDEFIEFYNNSSTALDISGYQVFDAFALASGTPRHIFPASTIIPANSFLVLFGGGTPTGTFGGSIVQVASEGADPQLNLSNGGDVITVLTPSDEVTLVYSSADTGISHSANESVTRDPDFTGSFVLHTTANASLAFSPGFLNSGSALSIGEDEFQNSLRLYPNPVSNGLLTISSQVEGDKSVEVYDVLGKNVIKTTLTTSDTLDVSTLKSGLYILNISIANRSITKRIVIN